jgi:hypothetical protein
METQDYAKALFHYQKAVEHPNCSKEGLRKIISSIEAGGEGKRGKK